MPGTCTRCRLHKEYGHRDAESGLYWYCEDCWLTFCGRRRRCALCKVLRDEGHVDQAVDYWYCLPCWEHRQAPPVAYRPPQYWPPAAYPAYPHPAYAPGYPPHPGLPGPGSSADRSRSRSPPRGGKKRRAAKDASGFKKEFKPYHATSVPKATDLSTDAQEGPATTAMLRNIPNKFSQKALLEEIDAEGFSGLYDFFYVPMDVRNKTNVGYAFINFLDPADMSRFSQHFEGYRFRNHNSQKIATVNPAHVQGLARNVQQLTKKAVLHFNNGEYKPVVFRDGKRVDFDDLAKEYSKK
ncbi:unnamed protein product [Durusdinium trenchii]|uniref:Uncharacterized protein n=2 Tax=Durusdinium trenchii TaxID=1381693 RepID=A0ABP0I9R9_9DINO